jgi:hypothetical protein
VHGRNAAATIHRILTRDKRRGKGSPQGRRPRAEGRQRPLHKPRGVARLPFPKERNAEAFGGKACSASCAPGPNSVVPPSANRQTARTGRSAHGQGRRIGTPAGRRSDRHQWRAGSLRQIL